MYSLINFPVKKKEKVTPYSFFLSAFIQFISIFFTSGRSFVSSSLSLSLYHTESSAQSLWVWQNLMILCGALFQCPKKPDPRHSLTASNVVNVTLSLLICRFHLCLSSFPLSFNCFYSKYYIKLNYYCTTHFYFYFCLLTVFT